jgi:predicted methyltransferase
MLKWKSAISIALLALSVTAACKKKEKDPPKTDPVPVTPAPADAGAPAPTADAGLSPTERVTAEIKKAEAEAAEEAKRWTDDMKKQAVALRDGKYKDEKEALEAILKSPHRTPKASERDAARHPVETLTFFGIKANQTVVELGAGGGWYTELLAPLLANKGKLIVAGADSAGPPDKMSTAYGKRLDLFLAKSPELFGKVERVAIKPPDIKLGPDGSADLVVAMREMHNWQRRKELDTYLKAIHAVLKDGGTFGLEAHRAKEGTKGEDTAEKGYLAEAWVIEKVTAAGFELVEKSEVNANPKDTKDYKEGVWTLPPNFALKETDKEKYAAIGESDRMTLRFKKVKKT